ncbi:GNAT family N-acetyltransferase [Tetragenococcus halophilus]|uniref:GNAT family N-acetyltransferase n=1 Tax=Tetragenococcus halophilus TaxID=51669 RepID=UPI0030F010A1
MLTIQELRNDSISIDDAKKIYFNSFPKKEQLPFSILKDNVELGKASFSGLFSDSQLVGIVYYTRYENLVYIFYFAIDAMNQSKGYGREAMKAIRNYFANDKIILLVEEIRDDAENNEQRKSRKSFYLRNGFVDSGKIMTEGGVRYEMLHSDNANVSIEDYEKVMDYFFKESSYSDGDNENAV